MGDFCRFFHIRTIPLAFRNANIYIYLFALTSALSLENRHHPCHMNALPVSHPHYPSPRTTLASTRKRVRFCCSVKPSQLWWGLLPISTINEIFRTIPRPALNLPPLSKGGGLTARHKLSLCCVLLAIHPPFLFTKLFAVKTEGLLHHPSLSTTSMPPLSKVRCCRPKKFGRLPEGLLFYRTLSVSQTPPLTIPQ